MGEQDDSEYLYEQLAAALGEDIHSVQNMDSEERNHLLKVCGIVPVSNGNSNAMEKKEDKFDPADDEVVGGKTEEREWIVGKQFEEKNDLLVDFIIKRNKDGTLNADVLKSWLRPCDPESRALDACFQLPEQTLAFIPDCVQKADENKLKKMLDSFYLNLKREGNDFVTESKPSINERLETLKEKLGRESSMFSVNLGWINLEFSQPEEKSSIFSANLDLSQESNMFSTNREFSQPKEESTMFSANLEFLQPKEESTMFSANLEFSQPNEESTMFSANLEFSQPTEIQDRLYESKTAPEKPLETERLESEPTKRRNQFPEDERNKIKDDQRQRDLVSKPIMFDIGRELMEQTNKSWKLIDPRDESRKSIDPRKKGTKPVDVQFKARGRARGKILRSFLEGPQPLGKDKQKD